MKGIHEWLYLLGEQISHTDYLQWVVLILGITEVFLARANNIWLYPVGIAASALALYSLLAAGLYAECLLHFYYVAMSLYGWWFWSRKNNSAPVEISRTTRREWIASALIVFGGWAALAIILIVFTSSTVPFWDAWVTSTAWAGTWLLARRKIENWLLLNLSNVFAIPLLIHKDLPLLALLTLFLFMVGWKGYLEWVRKYKSSRLRQTRADVTLV